MADYCNLQALAFETIDRLPQNEEQTTVAEPRKTSPAHICSFIADEIVLTRIYEHDGVCCSIHICFYAHPELCYGRKLFASALPMPILLHSLVQVTWSWKITCQILLPLIQTVKSRRLLYQAHVKSSLKSDSCEFCLVCWYRPKLTQGCLQVYRLSSAFLMCRYIWPCPTLYVLSSFTLSRPYSPWFTPCSNLFTLMLHSGSKSVTCGW